MRVAAHHDMKTKPRLRVARNMIVSSIASHSIPGITRFFLVVDCGLSRPPLVLAKRKQAAVPC